MDDKEPESITQLRTKTSAIALAVAVLAGCDPNSYPSAALKAGDLGNGDFLFACDDGAACVPYSGDARRFPDQVATGSNFDVRFIAKNQSGSVITINDTRYEGITKRAVAPYVGEGPDGFAALKPGYGTILVRDSRGTVIDFVTLKIVQPDGLVIYDADYNPEKGKDPPQIQAMNLKLGDVPSYRVLAEHGAEAVAGSIPVRWESIDTSVVAVESYARGVVSLRAKGVGTTRVRAAGAALTKEIDVEVTP